MAPPRFRPEHGSIEVIVGSMFSGKSEELIRRLRPAEIAKQKVQVLQPNGTRPHLIDALGREVYLEVASLAAGDPDHASIVVDGQFHEARDPRGAALDLRAEIEHGLVAAAPGPGWVVCGQEPGRPAVEGTRTGPLKPPHPRGP